MEQCTSHAEHAVRLKNLEKQLSDMADQRERITVVEQQSNFDHQRLDSLQEQTAAIIKMSMSIENIALQVKDILIQFKDHDNRLDVLEKAPGENVLGYWKQFIGAIITGVAGLVIGFYFIK